MVIARFKKWLSSPASTAADARAPHRLTARRPSDLLAPYTGELAQIRSRVGIPPEHWQSLYQPVFENYAALVQQLPASESHHHCGLGGLLQHGFEVVRHTLDLKQGVMLPPGGTPENQARVQDLWTYACVTAALLHDLGKPVTDQRITCYDTRGITADAWSPLRGPMTPGTVYGIAFNGQRAYRDHERIPPLLVHHLLSAEGLTWLSSDSEALFAWLAAIQGDLAEAGAIGKIIGDADGLSVGRNLSGSTNVRLPAARAKPLSERLVTGLRYLLDQNAIALNRPGAGGFLDGDALWLVSKTALDKLRTHLLKEGQPGIPSRNDRLMDELQQHGPLIPNDDRAVWTCEITIGDWRQSLTCLRFDANRLWTDPDRRPAAIEGKVTPIEGKTSTMPASGTQSTAPTIQTKPSSQPARTTPAIQDTSSSDPVHESIDDPLNELPMPFDLGSLGDSESTHDEPSGAESNTAPEPPAAPSETREPARSDGQVDGLDASEDAGVRFVAWLRQGIRDQTLEINTPRARLHVLPEGLALVSPKIFRDFDSANWGHVQKRFQKLGLHRKTADGKNIWHCQVVGKRKQSVLNVIVIPNASTVFDLCDVRPNSALKILQI